jgi:hypothetical protein
LVIPKLWISGTLIDEEITALAHYLAHLQRMLGESAQRSFEKIMRKA